MLEFVVVPIFYTFSLFVIVSNDLRIFQLSMSAVFGKANMKQTLRNICGLSGAWKH
jgi:hypothetical protein